MLSDACGDGKSRYAPPPDAAHRYVFVLFALKAALDISESAGFDKIAESILYNTIDVASLTAVYGPAKKPLPGS